MDCDDEGDGDDLREDEGVETTEGGDGEEQREDEGVETIDGAGEEQREDEGVETVEGGADEESDDERRRLGRQDHESMAEAAFGVTSSLGRTNRRCTSLDGDIRSTSRDFLFGWKYDKTSFVVSHGIREADSWWQSSNATRPKVWQMR